jgi:pantoate--beta-alanine ligase
MKIIQGVDKMRTYAKIIKKENKLVGLIPTMGYLHEGHLGLIRAAKKQSDIVILSIFVNPLQFGPEEDFEKYPRDIKKDEELAKLCGADVLFYPEKNDMYRPGHSTYVNVEGLTEKLEGLSRPGHFRGVTTVVAKLFEIIRPDIAYFGQKDVQQALVIKRMVEDLSMDITMKVLPTVREPDGLAMSSRNVYLTDSERKDAVCLFEALKLAEGFIAGGERDAKKVVKKMRDFISKISSAKIDYISIMNTESMEEVSEIKGEILIALAVFIGKTKLIDNMIINAEKQDKGNEK